MADGAVFAAGTIFHGRYEIVRCLKAGGMGAVYEVTDQKTLRRRALKVMLPNVVTDADMRARFGQEATITAAIESEHIVETFDADVDAETASPFIVMELLKGDDLGARLEREGKLSPAEVVTLLGQAALALDRTHAAGVVHRDLKPENLFLTQADSGAPKLKVLDFGIAKVVATSHDAKSTRTIGTPLYMAPEQILGEGTISHRADLYALGHIAYALLTGEPYWLEDAESTATFGLLSRVLAGPHEAATARAFRRHGVTLPGPFDVWFDMATAQAAADRFAKASDAVKALTVALGVATAPSWGAASHAPTVQLRTDSEAAVVPAGGAAPFVSEAAPVARHDVVASRSAATPSAETGSPLSSELPLTVPKNRSVKPVVVGAVVAVAGLVAVGVYAISGPEPVRSKAQTDAPKSEVTLSATAGTPPEPSVSVTPTEGLAASASASAVRVSAAAGGDRPPVGGGSQPVHTAPPQPSATSAETTTAPTASTSTATAKPRIYGER